MGKQAVTTASLRIALTELNPAKTAAVAALASGATHEEAAKAAGVKRETVTRWAGNHAGFRAALALLRHIDAEEQAARVSRIRSKALTAIESVLDSPEVDSAFALAVVRALPPIGPPTPPLDAEAILVDDIARLRPTLPPPPPIRDANGRVDPLAPMLQELNGYTGETPMERVERLAVDRLALACGIPTA